MRYTLLITKYTNAEGIATQVAAQYGLDPAQTVWIEHYPDRHPPGLENLHSFDESFDLVTFRWDETGVAHNPQWKRIAPTALERWRELPRCARSGAG